MRFSDQYLNSELVDTLTQIPDNVAARLRYRSRHIIRAGANFGDASKKYQRPSVEHPFK